MSTAIYEAITQQIVRALAEGVVPWRRPWHRPQFRPMNAQTKRPYQGVNLFILSLAGYSDPRWLTFRQAQAMGGNVRKGERATLVVFWKRWEPPALDSDEQTSKHRSIPLLRQYPVFNVEQVEGLKLEALIPESNHDRIAEAEAVIRAMEDCPVVTERGRDAFYCPNEDAITLPSLKHFNSPDAYYGVLFHELGHATGHEKRLNRPEVMSTVRFGSDSYSREELVAEFTSAFCCARLGLDSSMIRHSASYIDSWLQALENDKKAVIYAAGKAQRATDYIFNSSLE